MKIDNLAFYIHSFLQDYSTLQKGLSRHTILSYRDTIKLFLIFSAAQKRTSVTNLNLNDFTATMVLHFLEHLERERGNSQQTRNIRLACLHSFSRYLANHDPRLLDSCQNILAIPFKRTPCSSVEYLELEEMKAILHAVDRNNPDGYRDYTLFSFMYNTGARVQEVINLPASALQLERPYHVRFLGKGRKERLCPLWSETVLLLQSLLKQRGVDPKAAVLVFVNHRGQGLTRHGVRYLLMKYVKTAAKSYPSLERKHIHPHTIRHYAALRTMPGGTGWVVLSPSRADSCPLAALISPGIVFLNSQALEEGEQ